ncbi:MAG: hypothetical protein J6Z79_03445 [Clostridia bacterium]|nr:hypothetical protein [Clostridia bacterium]
MKRALALALSVVMVLTLLPLAVSARSLTDGEKSIFEELRSPAKVADGNFKLPEVVITMAENWLMGTEKELTQSDIDSILGFIRDAEQAVINGGTGVVEKWPQALRDQILKDIDGAAQVVGLHADGHAAGTNGPGDQHGYGSIEILDGSNKTIIAEDELVTVEYAPESDFEYEVVDGVVRITRYLGQSNNSTEVIVPATLGGKPVVFIGPGAFAGNANLTRISLPNTVKPENISETAFEGCVNLDVKKDLTFYDVTAPGKNGAIEPKGYDLTVVVICGVVGLAVLGVCVFVSKKAKLF